MKLIHGHGDKPGEVGCVMDFAVWRASEGALWADSHPCFNVVVTRAAQVVNDNLTGVGLDRLDRDFSARIDRARACANPDIERRVTRRLALWCARYVEHLSAGAKACNDVTERYLAGVATLDELGAWAVRTSAAWAAAEVEVAAEVAGAAAADDALLAYLDALLDAHQKILADEGGLADLLDYEAAGGS